MLQKSTYFKINFFKVCFSRYFLHNYPLLFKCFYLLIKGSIGLLFSPFVVVSTTNQLFSFFCLILRTDVSEKGQGSGRYLPINWDPSWAADYTRNTSHLWHDQSESGQLSIARQNYNSLEFVQQHNESWLASGELKCSCYSNSLISINTYKNYNVYSSTMSWWILRSVEELYKSASATLNSSRRQSSS